MARTPKKQPTRIDHTLTLAGLALLIVGCFLVLQPFLTAVVLAAILCVTPGRSTTNASRASLATTGSPRRSCCC
jgi:hypothetical protein